eukprot:1153933-Pelagomonas_calceolata.AAC.3
MPVRITRIAVQQGRAEFTCTCLYVSQGLRCSKVVRRPHAHACTYHKDCGAARLCGDHKDCLYVPQGLWCSKVVQRRACRS